jgi:hypothetical protein
MPDNHDLSRLPNLTAFAGEKPKSNVGLIRLLWPKIAACLDAGHTVRAIHGRLELDGIRIPYSTLCAGIAGIKTERNRSNPTAPAQSGERLSKAQTGDPLSNVKRLTGNRPGFEYTGTLPDEKLFGK